jgi:hypothetical protein
MKNPYRSFIKCTEPSTNGNYRKTLKDQHKRGKHYVKKFSEIFAAIRSYGGLHQKKKKKNKVNHKEAEFSNCYRKMDFNHQRPPSPSPSSSASWLQQ